MNYIIFDMEWNQSSADNVKVPELSHGEIIQIGFMVLDEQLEIVDYLTEQCVEMDKLIAKKEQFLGELEKYKKSLIYEYVTGKKEVPWDN